jgi:hypothetical protein
MATAGDVRKEQAEARVVERRRRLEEERKMRYFSRHSSCLTAVCKDLLVGRL